ncbi:MAG: MotA/TolQ/ExbB proton channel family protein [Myxococcota bacterium]|nr:MotA/TolQ/ExbB proton channel family protein [Myxococcota bacterium]
MTVTFLSATHGGGGEFDIFSNIFDSQGVVLAVLITLILMSVVCWLVIFYKSVWFRTNRSASEKFLASYWNMENPNHLYEDTRANPMSAEARIFVGAIKELGRISARQDGVVRTGFENIERAVGRQVNAEVMQLERLLPILATTGSAAPFIGLFGTVWGIMRAFGGLAEMGDEANLLTTVTPHIAEALVATAIGLLAAIPAVMAYNLFVQKVRRTATDIDGFGSDCLNTIRRLYFAE